MSPVRGLFPRLLRFAVSASWVLACSANNAGSTMNASGAAGTSTAPQAGTGAGGSSAGSLSGGSAGSGGTPLAGMGGMAGTTVAGGIGGAGSGSGGAGGGVGGTGGAIATGVGVSPNELEFGVVQQMQSAPQTVTLKNPSASPVQLAEVTLDSAAAGTAAFELVSPPQAGASVAAGASATVQVRFHPTSIALFKSSLLITTTNPDAKLTVGLYGLGTKGLEGANEPFLKIVLDTLGYDIDVGGNGLLGTGAALIGDEVAAPRFKAASAADIQMIPVARYSPQEPIPYGYYVGATETQVGVIANDQYQALNPTTDPGSKPSFAAPAGEFGIFTSSKTHETYTEDAKNAGNATKHAVRTYPLKNRAGAAIPSSYLLCFEEAANGDYQDYVFTLSNVIAVAP